MPELVINVPSYIGESYMDWENCEWVQGLTWADIEMQMWWAEAIGEPADSILLSIGVCEGGSTIEGFNIYNKLRALGIPIRSRVLGLAASMAVPIALAADEAPEMDYTAQLMIHSAAFYGGTNVETSVELRAQADRLDNTNQLLKDLFVARTGQPQAVIDSWFAKDTWLTATQAEALGLCSRVIPLAATTTAKAANTLITARRARFASAVARVGKHAIAARNAAKPKAKTTAKAAKSPRPMAKNQRPITAAARKVAGKPLLRPVPALPKSPL